ADLARAHGGHRDGALRRDGRSGRRQLRARLQILLRGGLLGRRRLYGDRGRSARTRRAARDRSGRALVWDAVAGRLGGELPRAQGDRRRPASGRDPSGGGGGCADPEACRMTMFLLQILRITVPYALAALGGAVSERSGVINIALEGTLLAGAFGAATASYYS